MRPGADGRRDPAEECSGEGPGAGMRVRNRRPTEAESVRRKKGRAEDAVGSSHQDEVVLSERGIQLSHRAELFQENRECAAGGFGFPRTREEPL